MKLLLQPNRWSCLPTAVAMVMRVTPKEVFDFLGHDGSQIVWPCLAEPFCRRSFHLEEMLEFCLDRLVYPTVLNVDTSYAPMDGLPDFLPYPNQDRILNHLSDHDAVLIGERDGNRHAVAWDQNMILDPEGLQYDLSEFTVETIMLVRNQINL
jgi:hypothetical protein